MQEADIVLEPNAVRLTGDTITIVTTKDIAIACVNQANIAGQERVVIYSNKDAFISAPNIEIGDPNTPEENTITIQGKTTVTSLNVEQDLSGTVGRLIGKKVKNMDLPSNILCFTHDLILFNSESGKAPYINPAFALSHTVKDELIINRGGGYKEGVVVEGKLHIEELYGNKINAVVCKTTALILDSDERRSEGHKSPEEMRRALVHDVDDSLTINYEKDYPGGVAIKGTVKVSDELIMGSPTDGIRVNKEGIKIRTQKIPSANDIADTTQRGKVQVDNQLTLKSIAVIAEEIIIEELKAVDAPITRKLRQVYEFDLVEQIYELRSEVKALKAEIAELKTKA